MLALTDINKCKTDETKIQYANIEPLETDDDEKIFLRSYKACLKDLEGTNICYYKYSDPNMNEDIRKIALLKREISINFFEIGKILKKHQERWNKKDYKYFLKHPMIAIKKTQAQKMIAAYKYIASERLGQLTGLHIRLGIEKIYLISTVKNNKFYDELENFTLNKQINVKTLQLIVENIKNNDGMTVEEAYAETLQEVEAKKKSRAKNSLQTRVTLLQEENNQLKAEAQALKEELEKLKNQNIDK